MERRELPKGWEWKTLGAVADIVRGGSPRPKGDPRFFGGSIPWIMISDINREKGKFISKTRDHVTDEGARRSRFLQIGTLILSNSGTVCVPKILAVDGCIHDGFIAFLDLKTDIDKFYLYYYLDYIRPFVFAENQRGVTQVNLNTNIVKKIPIPIPPLPIQRRIVEILERADALRLLRAQADAETQELLQSVFYEMFGDPVRNEKGWEIVEFKDCYNSIRYGVSSPPIFAEKGIPFLRATNIKNGTILENNLKYVSLEDSKEIEKCFIKEGNVIIVRSGVNTGDCAYIPQKYDGSLAAYDIVIEFNEREQGQFYNYYLSTKFCRSQINLLKRRAAQEHLNIDQISSLKVPVPPHELQQQFANIIRSINSVRELQEKSKRENECFFDGLMTKAFAGELN